MEIRYHLKYINIASFSIVMHHNFHPPKFRYRIKRFPASKPTFRPHHSNHLHPTLPQLLRHKPLNPLIRILPYLSNLREAYPPTA